MVPYLARVSPLVKVSDKKHDSSIRLAALIGQATQTAKKLNLVDTFALDDDDVGNDDDDDDDDDDVGDGDSDFKAMMGLA